MQLSARGQPATIPGLDVVREQALDVADWITASGDLQLISGERGPLLTPARLADWLDGSIAGAVGVHEGEVIGLATLSRAEADLPQGSVEICHLIVRPEWRRRYRASQLVCALMSEAQSQGFTRVVGRVVPGNAPATALLDSLSWRREGNLEDRYPGFIWRSRQIRSLT